MQGPQYIFDGCPRLRITRDRAKNIDFTLNTPPGRTCAMTGSGTDTGAAARRGHDDLQRGHRRTHPVNTTAHWATAARTRRTDFSQCLPGGHQRRERNGSTFSGSAREREARRAQHRLIIQGYDGRRRLRLLLQQWIDNNLTYLDARALVGPHDPAQGHRHLHRHLWNNLDENGCAYCAFRPRAPPNTPADEVWKYGTGDGAHNPVTCPPYIRYLCEAGAGEFPVDDGVKALLRSLVVLKRGLTSRITHHASAHAHAGAGARHDHAWGQGEGAVPTEEEWLRQVTPPHLLAKG
eukprot:scaffold9044_cov120-Isochrysis_galbana.AAC.3